MYNKYTCFVPKHLKLWVFLLLTFNSFAQTDTTDVFELSIENISQIDQDQLSKKVKITQQEESWSRAQQRSSLAGKISKNEQQTPAILSVITQRDIQLWGARDLTDVLRLVPGFDFGIDVNSIFSAGFRGTWAHEGKLLLMINGVIANEYAFGNINLFGNYPVSMIERVEILRGPGSVLYGGFAEVAIINIITAKGAELNGLRIHGNGGVVGKGAFNRGVGMSVGIRKNDLELAVQAGYNLHIPSTRNYEPFIDTVPRRQILTPVSGPLVINRLALNEQTFYRQAKYIVAQGKIKNLNFNFHSNSFTFSAMPHWFVRPFVNNVNGERRNNTVTAGKLEYVASINEDWQIIPSLEYSESNQISMVVNPAQSFQSNWRHPGVRMWRPKTEVLVDYQSKLIFGVGYFQDHIYATHRDGRPGLQLSSNPADSARTTHTRSAYGYAQYSDNFGDWGLTAGARYENTSFGDAFAPRLGLTYTKNKFNTKILYGRSFRIPMPFQTYTMAWSIPVGGLKPEIASTTELEAGYQFSKAARLKANLFYIDIKSPIVFIGTSDSYENFGRLRSAGMESEFSLRYKRYGGFVNLAYTTPLNNTSANFKSTDNTSFIGFAPLKINAGAYYQIKKISFAPSFSWISQRVGASEQYALASFNAADPATVPLQNAIYGSIGMVNATLTWLEAFKCLDVSLSAYNLFNTDYKIIQPFYDTHAPISVNDRNIILSIVWKY